MGLLLGFSQSIYECFPKMNLVKLLDKISSFFNYEVNVRD
jgi:hypothetical protein